MPDLYRSMLFVPGDSARKLARAEAAGADALILDLEDSISAQARPAARGQVAEYLIAAQSRCSRLFVRINPLRSGDALADLAAVMAGKPDGIMLPKARSPADAITLGHYLDAFEAQHGVPQGYTRIIAVATELPEALFAMGDYRKVGRRLGALTWGAEDLSSAIGAIGNKNDAGDWSQPFALARSLCLFAAASAGVAAIDTLFADFRDAHGLAEATARSRRDGFGGRIAIHPDQVPIINAAFSPSADEIAAARQIIALFEANPGAGVLSLDGAMLNAPHLARARRTLARCDQPRDGS